jgi:hypothetical protein
MVMDWATAKAKVRATDAAKASAPASPPVAALVSAKDEATDAGSVSAMAMELAPGAVLYAESAAASVLEWGSAWPQALAWLAVSVWPQALLLKVLSEPVKARLQACFRDARPPWNCVARAEAKRFFLLFPVDFE